QILRDRVAIRSVDRCDARDRAVVLGEPDERWRHGIVRRDSVRIAITRRSWEVDKCMRHGIEAADGRDEMLGVPDLALVERQIPWPGARCHRPLADEG